METTVKRMTLKKLNQVHPDFEVTKHPRGEFNVKHKPTGKTVVCILGNKIGPIHDFLNDVEENPEQLNQKSYFRNTTPTEPNPYKDGGKVRVIATQEELERHFGRGQKFCKPGEELVLDSSGWSDLSDQWQPSFDNPNDCGGFWLQPWMVEVL